MPVASEEVTGLFGATGGLEAPFGLFPAGAFAFTPIRGEKALSADGNRGSRLRSSSLIQAFEILAPAHGLMRRKVRMGMTLSRKSRSFKSRLLASPNRNPSGLGLSLSEASSVSSPFAAGRFFGSMLFVAY